ncbi:MAG: NAD+ synthase, partial [Acidimicrobiia bacterium]
PILGRDLANGAVVMHEGAVVGTYAKQLLPNYGVFDEHRYFEPGTSAGPLFEIAGVRCGVSICEDSWSPTGPLLAQAQGGAQLFLNLNASPYYVQKTLEREAMLRARADDNGVAIAYCNLVGGQDELVFDGGSMVLDAQGALVARAAHFVEELMLVDIEIDDEYRKRLTDPRGAPSGEPLPVVTLTTASRASSGGPVAASITSEAIRTTTNQVIPVLDPEAEIYDALVLGTRDYCAKTGFHDVIVSLSGGIDSALVTCIAVDALGPEHVTVVLQPSRYSSDHSVDDSIALAERLGVKTHTIAIEPAHSALEAMVSPALGGRDPGLAFENLQARIRGTVVMTLSNATGALVLTTGNKSEMAVGYATLYGDMAGGYAVIKDVLKTEVYKLARWKNASAGSELIPTAIIDKPPSAELRPDQLDSDSLPPYEILDAILTGYVIEDRSIGDIIRDGFDEATLKRVAKMVDRNEYKRRQAPPGVRVSAKAFGRDRRLPIANGWTDTTA